MTKPTSPPEAQRGRTVALVFGGLGVVAMIISLTFPDNTKDWESFLMLIATCMGPVLAFFGTLIAAIACVRSNPMTGGHVAGFALNIVLMIGWLWRWGTVL